MRHEIRYGKAEISVYRTHARPLEGVPSIPESSFRGRDNTLFAALVTVDVYGDNFLPAYTDGDNSQVVATDTMKNFTYSAALEFEGATLEEFAEFLSSRFLDTYPQMQRIALHCRELPFAAHSEKLLSPRHDDHATVELHADRSGVLSMECGRRDLRLIKLTGSAFARFARDRYTTLPERRDRPLFIYLDVFWRYGADRSPRVPSEQVADLVRHTFDGFVSMSIQHLVHEMGRRLLARFPQLSVVRLEAQNRLWDASAKQEDGPAKVFSDPKPAHGSIGLTLSRA